MSRTKPYPIYLNISHLALTLPRGVVSAWRDSKNSLRATTPLYLDDRVSLYSMSAETAGDPVECARCPHYATVIHSSPEKMAENFPGSGPFEPFLYQGPIGECVPSGGRPVELAGPCTGEAQGFLATSVQIKNILGCLPR